MEHMSNKEFMDFLDGVLASGVDFDQKKVRIDKLVLVVTIKSSKFGWTPMHFRHPHMLIRRSSGKLFLMIDNIEPVENLMFSNVDLRKKNRFDYDVLISDLEDVSFALGFS